MAKNTLKSRNTLQALGKIQWLDEGDQFGQLEWETPKI
jgi:hypothetical protein